MLRLIGGVIVGVVGWMLVVTAIDLGLRHGWPAYAAVEKAMLFTLPMMIARLAMSAVSSLVGGYAAARIDKGGWAAPAAGTILLLMFLPTHYALWHHFPIWYHLTFLISLPLLSIAGGKFVRQIPMTAQP